MEKDILFRFHLSDFACLLITKRDRVNLGIPGSLHAMPYSYNQVNSKQELSA